MKNNSPVLARIAVLSGLALGAFALSALATGTWTPPSMAPTGGNVDAPINVGPTDQTKTGLIIAGGFKTTARPSGERVSIDYNSISQLQGGYDLVIQTFGTGGNIFMNPDPNLNGGNVGIGTLAVPQGKLEVVGGPIKATGGLIIETRTDTPPNPETGRMWLVTN